MKKRILSAFFAFMMIMSALVIPAAADDLNDHVVAWFDFEGADLEERVSDKAPAGIETDVITVLGEDNKIENGTAIVSDLSGNVMLLEPSDDIRDMYGKTYYFRFRPKAINAENYDAQGNNIFATEGDKLLRLWTRSSDNGKSFFFGSWMLDQKNENNKRYDHEEKVAPDAEWVHAAYTVDYDDETMYLNIYMSTDGVNYSVFTNYYANVASTVWSRMFLGKLDAAGNNGRGKPIEFDDIRVYDKILTAEEVATIAAHTPAGGGAVAKKSLSNFAKVNTYTDGRFSDVKAADWFNANVGAVYAYGLMKGNSDTTFNPTGSITVAETITLLARINAIYMGKVIDESNANPWYQPYVDYAKNEGLLTETFADYGAAITRADFARLLSRSVPEKELAEVNAVAPNAIPDVKDTDSFASAVYMLYRAGIVTGSDDKGTFNPATGISRAESAALVTRIVDPTLRKSIMLGYDIPAGDGTISTETHPDAAKTKMTIKSIFKNNMMLQQKKPFSITGTFTEVYGSYHAQLCIGNAVLQDVPVTIDPLKKTFSADFAAVDGSYEKYSIRILNGTYKVKELTNVVFGELWIATGQSNMAYTLTKDQDFPSNFVKDEYVRVMMVNKPAAGYSATPLDNHTNISWVLGNNQTAMSSASAVAYYFTRVLREKLDVPVGFIFYAVGGCPVRSWISRETINATPFLTTNSAIAKNYKPISSWDKTGYRQATAVYNSMVAPTVGLQVAGLIWYQGEQDMNERAGTYAEELDVMYRQYCRLFGFGEGEMPFIMSMIVPYLNTGNPQYYAPFTASVAAYAASETMVSAPAMYDMCPEHDKNNNAGHPHEKKPIGERMAASAMAMVYGETGYSSEPPIAVSTATSGSTLTLTFANVADGLCITGGSSVLRGFTVCGADGVYYPANAKIVGKDKVELSSPSVPSPVSATYAYELNAYNCNLGCTYGGELLYVASPFGINMPKNASTTPTILYADFDLPLTWHLTRDPDHFAKQYNTWTAKQNKKEIGVSYDKAVKAQGDSSLKVAVPAEGAFTVSPLLIGETMQGTPILLRDQILDYTRFGKLTVKIKNDSDTALTVGDLKIGSGFAKPSVTSIPAKSGWVEVSFDLKKLYNASGSQLTNVSLKSFAAMDFNFTAGGAGSVYVDDLQFLK